jgi:hypothetical protein
MLSGLSLTIFSGTRQIIITRSSTAITTGRRPILAKDRIPARLRQPAHPGLHELVQYAAALFALQAGIPEPPNVRVSGHGKLPHPDFERNKEVVFSRKFILYEDLVSVPMQIKSARNLNVIDYKQNVRVRHQNAGDHFSRIRLKTSRLLLMQNGRFDNAIYNSSRNIRLAMTLFINTTPRRSFGAGMSSSISKTKTSEPRAITSHSSIRAPTTEPITRTYTKFRPSKCAVHVCPGHQRQLRGKKHQRRTRTRSKPIMPGFTSTLAAPAFFGKKDIYVNGMFNNFAFCTENKMEYNAAKGGL